MKSFSMFKPLGLTLGCTVLCLSASLRAEEQVPFKGHFDLTMQHPPVYIDPTHLQADVDVTIRATQLGDGHGPARFVVDVTTLSYVGETTWYAANGDALFFRFAGQFVPAYGGVLDNLETFEIVGGTGRFKGATGAGVCFGQMDGATLLPVSPIPFIGTISSPGSVKK
jgi:hypothetical protein